MLEPADGGQPPAQQHACTPLDSLLIIEKATCARQGSVHAVLHLWIQTSRHSLAGWIILLGIPRPRVAPEGKELDVVFMHV